MNISLSQARNFLITLPPTDEQREIVRRVSDLFALADAIERRVAAATTRADRLTQAILAKAFRGELVPTEAELARQEGRDYEPASVLLERNRAERAAAVVAPRKGRPKQRAARKKTRAAPKKVLDSSSRPTRSRVSNRSQTRSRTR